MTEGTARTWEPFLTERDRAFASALPLPPPGAIGERPVLLMIDLYRWAYGDRPLPLAESIQEWPGSCGMTGWDAIPATVHLLDAARRARIQIVHATVLPGAMPRPPRRHQRHASTGLDGLDRWHDPFAFKEEFAPIDGEIVIEKIAASSFFGTPLGTILTRLECDTLIVAGETTSGCVRASVVDAWQLGYLVTVVEECVFDRTEASHAMSLFDIDQKYGNVRPVNEVVAELDQRGVHPALEPYSEPAGVAVARPSNGTEG